MLGSRGCALRLLLASCSRQLLRAETSSALSAWEGQSRGTSSTAGRLYREQLIRGPLAGLRLPNGVRFASSAEASSVEPVDVLDIEVGARRVDGDDIAPCVGCSAFLSLEPQLCVSHHTPVSTTGRHGRGSGGGNDRTRVHNTSRVARWDQEPVGSPARAVCPAEIVGRSIRGVGSTTAPTCTRTPHPAQGKARRSSSPQMHRVSAAWHLACAQTLGQTRRHKRGGALHGCPRAPYPLPCQGTSSPDLDINTRSAFRERSGRLRLRG